LNSIQFIGYPSNKKNLTKSWIGAKNEQVSICYLPMYVFFTHFEGSCQAIF
jgi:hypothetical protein